MAPSEFRRLRHTSGLTQRELADRIGTSQTAIAAMESGMRKISDRTERLVLEALAPDELERQRNSIRSAVDEAFCRPHLAAMRRAAGMKCST